MMEEANLQGNKENCYYIEYDGLEIQFNVKDKFFYQKQFEEILNTRCIVNSSDSVKQIFQSLCEKIYTKWENDLFTITDTSPNYEHKKFNIKLKTDQIYVEMLWGAWIFSTFPLDLYELTDNQKRSLIELKNEIDTYDLVTTYITITPERIQAFPETPYFDGHLKNLEEYGKEAVFQA